MICFYDSNNFKLILFLKVLYIRFITKFNRSDTEFNETPILKNLNQKLEISLIDKSIL